MIRTEAVLVYVFRDHHVLLGRHLRGIGKGRWNGLGGKCAVKESAKEAAVRECTEEVGIKVKLNQPLGRILYHHPRIGDWRVTIFRTEEFVGQPRGGDEMMPRWFSVEQLPYREMWDNNRAWLHHVIRHHHFEGEVWLDAQDHLVRHTIMQVPRLSDLGGEA